VPNSVWFWVVLVLAVAAVVGAVLLVRRRRYLERVRALGWSHDSRPALAAVADLQAPPFGMGLERSIDELVSGSTPTGFGFRAFEYGYSGAGPRYSGRVAAVELPFALPDVFLGDAGHARTGIASGGRTLVQAADGDLRAIAADASLATDLLAVVAGAVRGFAQAGGTVDLGIDGNHLVAPGAPKDPEKLAAFLAALDPVAQAVATSTALNGRRVSPPAASRFYGHPDWTSVGVDDAVLDWYPVSTGGYGHRTEDLVRGLRDGIRLDAFTHHWKTDRIETTTDAEGHTHTRTVTDHHSEPVCGFVLPFTLPAISVNGRRVGRKVQFESTDFNEAFTVRTDDPKFASDVIHPRMMEWLLATAPRGWTASGRIVVFEVEQHDLLIVDACEAVLRGWLGRVPRFVWQDLGLQPPPYLVE
jgi:hypothetical protein